MRRIVRAIYHTNGTYYHIGPAAVAICKYLLCPSMNITCDLVKPATHLAILYADRRDRIKSPISGMSDIGD